MSIEHRNIPESGLHEPKGISLAPSKRIYISDGAGSGSWDQADADSIKGTVSNATVAGRRIVTDGSGGFDHEPTPASSYGTMNLTENDTAQSLTAATDSTLRTDSDYTPLTVVMSYASVQNMTTGSNSLQINEEGVYLVDFWANVRSSTNSTKFGLKFVINDVDFVARAPKVMMTSSGTLHNLSANGIHTFTAGDVVKIYIASSTTSDITIEDLTFQLAFLGGI